MKNIILNLLCLLSLQAFAQIETPKLSPASTLTQKVGLTDVTIKYSRPSKRNREVFGNVVPMDAVWRTGANENTTITISDDIIFGKDTLPEGKYAVYTIPSEKSWTIYFYTKTDNWGTPDNWEESNIALTTTATPIKTDDVTESFTIAIDNVTTEDAVLCFSWDKTKVTLPFSVPTSQKVEANISAVMSGPTSNDYYRAADYYLTEKRDLKQAGEWINKAIELRGDRPFWMYYKKALIEVELENYSEAVSTAKIALQEATSAGNETYISRCEALIEKYSKKK